ncbi:ABC transporter ATP-binding protein [Paenalcaligenes niemegkensis]|uniref:ABC transporter ATP-binding protein n=1 Tax=Paenalcaligenes niemegkensis TaxID=2895469 RepID=UPI001EE8849D|nr:ABC transporter ATP-binding protein [Paenalcaligenes niemegkensis]MCQ9616511.1 ABC transporter ATP-binding protein [Paenalcaligenes niemegkensis]
MSELTVENIKLAYDKNLVLDGVSMTIAKGEVVSLLGASGSGKTTLLRAVAGLEQPLSGRIQISSQLVFDGAQKLEVPAEQRNLGLVFQSYALWPHKTVAENVIYPLKLRRTPEQQAKSQVSETLTHLGLAGLESRYPNQLSGGQQQRVAIARAIVYNPPVLLLDEPLSNLDAKLREEARAFLRELIVNLNLSALLVTHDQDEAMAISDRILLLNQGRIEQQGTPEHMYSAPESLYAAEFMGSNNRISGTVSVRKDGDVCITTAYGELWGSTSDSLQVGDEVSAICRVEQTQVSSHVTEGALSLPLTTSMYLGDKWEYIFKLPNTDSVLRAYGKERLSPGTYFVQLPPKVLWAYAA